jgi:Amt family ammonium transporter
VSGDVEAFPLGKDASVLTQLYGIVFTILWTAIASAVILFVLKATIGLRPTKQEEIEGLDIALHGEVVQ